MGKLLLTAFVLVSYFDCLESEGSTRLTLFSGSTSAYCGQNCQNGFGECTNQQSSSSHSSSPARSSTSSPRSSSTSATATTTSAKLSSTTSSKPVSSSFTHLVSSSVTSAASSSSTHVVSSTSSNVVSSTSIGVSSSVPSSAASSAISSVISSSSNVISSTTSLTPSSTSTPTPSGVPSVNLLLNPSYEQGTLDWVTIVSQYIANVSTPTGDAHQGNSYYAATTLYEAAENLNTIFLEQPTVVIPETTTVYVSVWVRVTVPATSSSGSRFSFNIYIDGDNTPGRVDGLTPGQPWYNIQTSLTLTAGTHNIGLALSPDFPTIGSVVEVDDWLATVGPPVICVSV